jgi:hypothetical protein
MASATPMDETRKLAKEVPEAVSLGQGKPRALRMAFRSAP